MKTAIESFGPNLRAARKRAGLTQQDVAATVGITQVYLSYVETGKAVPSLALAEKLASAVGKSLAKLFRENLATDLAKVKPRD